MTVRIPAAALALALLTFVVAPTGPLAAQDETGWTDVAEFTFVQTAGNASSSTFGLKNTLDRIFENGAFKLTLGGVRTSSTQRSTEAVGTPSDFSPVETSGVTAANYFARARYDRSVSENAYVFGGSGWNRNTFAGIENRYNFVTGAGRTWRDGEGVRFKTDVGVTYTVQDDVIPTPGASDGFFGLTASWDYLNQITETTQFGSELIVDENLSDTDDLRADFTNFIAVAISDQLALKTSLQLLFDNQPALEQFTLRGTTTQVTRDLESVDSVFTVALVVNF